MRKALTKHCECRFRLIVVLAAGACLLSLPSKSHANKAPTDIILSNNTVVERQPAGTRVGVFSTADPDIDQGHVYSLVEGEGADDNGSFAIEDDALLTAESFDFTTKDTYSIRVRTDDQNGGIYEKGFTISVRKIHLEVTLQWDANPEPEVTGYKVYYKTESSGERVLSAYNGSGLVWLKYDGAALEVDSGFEIGKEDFADSAFPSCRLGGVDPVVISFFVVTALDEEGHESLPSREVSTDDIPPSKPSGLGSYQDPQTGGVTFFWSPSVDPAPGSGVAGYSYGLDAFADTIPDAIPDAISEEEDVRSALFFGEGRYWFHIRAIDKAGLAERNASETDHFGPICIDTRLPSVEYAFIDFENSILYVEYSENHMQNAALLSNYSLENGLGMLGDGADLYGDGRVLVFRLDSAVLERYFIYRLTISEAVTDCAGNPLNAGGRTVVLNDDDGDGMADEWEILWFEGIWSKDGLEDSDGDGFLDVDEFSYAMGHPEWGPERWTLSPLSADSDGDGIPDGYEIQNGLNPTDPSDRDMDPRGNRDALTWEQGRP